MEPIIRLLFVEVEIGADTLRKGLAETGEPCLPYEPILKRSLFRALSGIGRLRCRL